MAGPVARTTNTFGKLITPHNTSEFHALVDRARRYHNALHDQTVTVAPEMYRGLIDKIHGPGWTRLQARSVTRHLFKAAGLDNAAAAEWVAAWRAYQQVIAGSKAKHKSKFDVNK